MRFERFLLVLGARRRVFLLTALGTAALVIALALAIGPRYKATAAVLVERGVSDPIAGVPLPAGVLSSYIATQADILASQEVALRAVRALGLEKDAQWHSRWKAETGEQGSFNDWLAAHLLQKVKVSPSRDSNVIGVAYTAADAQFASAVVNAFVQAYIDTTLELRVDPARAYNRFFAERAEQLRLALERAQAKLTAYQEKHGLMATDEGVDVETRRLAELNTQLVEMEDAYAAAKARQAQARTSPREIPEVLADPVVASLSAELARQEAKLTEMKSHLGAQNPDLIEAAAGVEELRKRTQAAVERAASAAGASLRVAEQRLSELRSAVARQRDKLTAQKAQRDMAAVLTRDVENATRAYDNVLARTSQTALESANQQTNVSWLKVASPPALPLWPAWLPFLAALALGLVVGTGSALALEMFDRRLRTPQDVRLGLGQVLLLELPDGRKALSADKRPQLVRGASQLAPS